MGENIHILFSSLVFLLEFHGKYYSTSTIIPQKIREEPQNNFIDWATPPLHLSSDEQRGLNKNVVKRLADGQIFFNTATSATSVRIHLGGPPKTESVARQILVDFYNDFLDRNHTQVDGYNVGKSPSDFEKKWPVIPIIFFPEGRSDPKLKSLKSQIYSTLLGEKKKKNYEERAVDPITLMMGMNYSTTNLFFFIFSHQEGCWVVEKYINNNDSASTKQVGLQMRIHYWPNSGHYDVQIEAGNLIHLQLSSRSASSRPFAGSNMKRLAGLENFVFNPVSAQLDAEARLLHHYLQGLPPPHGGGGGGGGSGTISKILEGAVRQQIERFKDHTIHTLNTISTKVTAAQQGSVKRSPQQQQPPHLDTGKLKEQMRAGTLDMNQVCLYASNVRMGASTFRPGSSNGFKNCTDHQQKKFDNLLHDLSEAVYSKNFNKLATILDHLQRQRPEAAVDSSSSSSSSGTRKRAIDFKTDETARLACITKLLLGGVETGADLTLTAFSLSISDNKCLQTQLFQDRHKCFLEGGGGDKNMSHACMTRRVTINPDVVQVLDPHDGGGDGSVHLDSKLWTPSLMDSTVWNYRMESSKEISEMLSNSFHPFVLADDDDPIFKDQRPLLTQKASSAGTLAPCDKSNYNLIILEDLRRTLEYPSSTQLNGIVVPSHRAETRKRKVDCGGWEKTGKYALVIVTFGISLLFTGTDDGFNCYRGGGCEFQVAGDSHVVLDEGDGPRYASASSPDILTGKMAGNFLKFDFDCKVAPGGSAGDKKASSPGYGYLCTNAMGLWRKRDDWTRGSMTYVNLLGGNDQFKGFKNRSAHYIEVGGGHKIFVGGDQNDIFILNSTKTRGILDGGNGTDSLIISEHITGTRRGVPLTISISSNNSSVITGAGLEMFDGPLKLYNFERIFGRISGPEILTISGGRMDSINLGGGGNFEQNEIINIPALKYYSAIEENGHFYHLKIDLHPFTQVVVEEEGNFLYTAPFQLPNNSFMTLKLTSNLSSWGSHNFSGDEKNGTSTHTMQYRDNDEGVFRQKKVQQIFISNDFTSNSTHSSILMTPSLLKIETTLPTGGGFPVPQVKKVCGVILDGDNFWLILNTQSSSSSLVNDVHFKMKIPTTVQNSISLHNTVQDPTIHFEYVIQSPHVQSAKNNNVNSILTQIDLHIPHFNEGQHNLIHFLVPSLLTTGTVPQENYKETIKEFQPPPSNKMVVSGHHFLLQSKNSAHDLNCEFSSQKIHLKSHITFHHHHPRPEGEDPCSSLNLYNFLGLLLCSSTSLQKNQAGSSSFQFFAQTSKSNENEEESVESAESGFEKEKNFYLIFRHHLSSSMEETGVGDVRPIKFYTIMLEKVVQFWSVKKIKPDNFIIKLEINASSPLHLPVSPIIIINIDPGRRIPPSKIYLRQTKDGSISKAVKSFTIIYDEIKYATINFINFPPTLWSLVTIKIGEFIVFKNQGSSPLDFSQKQVREKRQIIMEEEDNELNERMTHNLQNLGSSLTSSPKNYLGSLGYSNTFFIYQSSNLDSLHGGDERNLFMVMEPPKNILQGGGLIGGQQSKDHHNNNQNTLQISFDHYQMTHNETYRISVNVPRQKMSLNSLAGENLNEFNLKNFHHFRSSPASRTVDHLTVDCTVVSIDLGVESLLDTKRDARLRDKIYIRQITEDYGGNIWEGKICLKNLKIRLAPSNVMGVFNCADGRRTVLYQVEDIAQNFTIYTTPVGGPCRKLRKKNKNKNTENLLGQLKKGSQKFILSNVYMSNISSYDSFISPDGSRVRIQLILVDGQVGHFEVVTLDGYVSLEKVFAQDDPEVGWNDWVKPRRAKNILPNYKIQYPILRTKDDYEIRKNGVFRTVQCDKLNRIVEPLDLTQENVVQSTLLSKTFTITLTCGQRGREDYLKKRKKRDQEDEEEEEEEEVKKKIVIGGAESTDILRNDPEIETHLVGNFHGESNFFVIVPTIRPHLDVFLYLELYSPLRNLRENEVNIIFLTSFFSLSDQSNYFVLPKVIEVKEKDLVLMLTYSDPPGMDHDDDVPSVQNVTIVNGVMTSRKFKVFLYQSYYTIEATISSQSERSWRLVIQPVGSSPRRKGLMSIPGDGVMESVFDQLFHRHHGKKTLTRIKRNSIRTQEQSDIFYFYSTNDLIEYPLSKVPVMFLPFPSQSEDRVAMCRSDSSLIFSNYAPQPKGVGQTQNDVGSQQCAGSLLLEQGNLSTQQQDSNRIRHRYKIYWIDYNDTLLTSFSSPQVAIMTPRPQVRDTAHIFDDVLDFSFMSSSSSSPPPLGDSSETGGLSVSWREFSEISRFDLSQQNFQKLKNSPETINTYYPDSPADLSWTRTGILSPLFLLLVLCLMSVCCCFFMLPPVGTLFLTKWRRHYEREKLKNGAKIVECQSSPNFLEKKNYLLGQNLTRFPTEGNLERGKENLVIPTTTAASEEVQPLICRIYEREDEIFFRQNDFDHNQASISNHRIFPCSRILCHQNGDDLESQIPLNEHNNSEEDDGHPTSNVLRLAHYLKSMGFTAWTGHGQTAGRAGVDGVISWTFFKPNN